MTIPPPKTKDLPYPGGVIHLTAEADALPTLPEGIPTPSVSIELGGEVRTVVMINDFPVRFWETPVDEFNDLWETRKRKGSWVHFLTEEQIEAVQEWGAAVHKRLDGFAYQLLVAALTTSIEERMVEFAQEA